METLDVVGKKYHPRVVDAEVAEALNAAGAVIVEGVRACGKTMTGLHAAESFVFADDPVAQQLRDVAPQSLLDGPTPRLLDEWQTAPELWNLVRRRVDAATGTGLFLLTGSAVPADDDTRHTGAGRFVRIRERTMTWWERPHSPSRGGVSLAALFADEGTPPATQQPMSLLDIIDNLVKPGFPALADRSAQRSRALLTAFLGEVSRVDLMRLVDLRHDPAVIRALMASIARNVSSNATYTTLAEDVRAVAPAITPETIARYVDALERLFVVEPQPAWTPTLRSRARLRTSAKLHLADPALAATALGASPAQLALDTKTTGLLFESAVVHDLRVFAGRLGGEVRHFRDSSGYEIDAVVLLPDGRWGGVEVKLGGLQLAQGAASLAKAVSQIDTAAVGEPAFRLVITGTGNTFALADGTVTCPHTALEP